MPSRWISLVILVYWSIAAFLLLKWDVLPELTTGYPPDLRGIAFASDSSRPVRWSIQVLDDPRSRENRRTVGEAVTASTRQADGWFEMTSRVEFDAGDLLKGTLLAIRDSVRVEVKSRYNVDPAGNLQNFEVNVSSDLGDEMVHIAGRLRDGRMNIVSRGPIPIMNRNDSVKYEPRSVVSDLLGPLDRLPGLHVGQRWEMQSVNPFTGRTESSRAEVTRRTVIHWAGNPVSTYEVEQQMSTLRVHTWVATDGMILRQEVPFPMVHLILERRGDDAAVPAPSASSPTTARSRP
ncbi:MAG: hypothetical protein ACYC61_10295 [Isosphaeraceae bacterium]